jgi:sarcosine oxidase subunit alpha
MEVGGVLCLMLRIGFVGETGWEIHFPAEYGEYLWNLIIESGRDKGIQAFGVETQRILRLEKKHIIVSVDTDATSNPIESDLAWVVKLDKEDFIGKTAILRTQARGMREKLIGFVVQDAVVPEDGAAIVQNGKPIGRVTSVRFSPVKGKAVGLAWLPANLTNDGQEIFIHVNGHNGHNGQLAKAQIVPDPFYDPEGKRLRM